MRILERKGNMKQLRWNRILIFVLVGMLVGGCGALEESPEEALVVSILGDSISTFEGYIPEADDVNLKHTTRYPQENLVMEVEETWWMQVISKLNDQTEHGARLGINDSWSATMVYNDLEENDRSFGPDSCMASMTRIQNLGSNGDPDLIFFYGGTNDVLHLVPLGEFKPESEGRTVAAGEVDLNAATWTTFAEAYEAAILRLRSCYSDAELLVMLPTYADGQYYTEDELAKYNAVMAEICKHYGVSYIDLRDSGVTVEHLPDGIHPGYEGMDLIEQSVLLKLAELGIL